MVRSPAAAPAGLEVTAGRYDDLLAEAEKCAETQRGVTGGWPSDVIRRLAAALRESEEENARLRQLAADDWQRFEAERADLLADNLGARGSAWIAELRDEVRRFEDFSNEIVANAGDEWDGDEDQEAIAIRYVRWLEAGRPTEWSE